MWLKHKMRTFLADESGQTTTEYILILAVVITLVMQLRGKLVSTMKKLLKSIDEDVMEVTDHEADL
jgi:Flp pilus assembly pilin Flp